MERFWSKVDRSGECWTWKAYRNARGYGYFALRKRMGLGRIVPPRGSRSGRTKLTEEQVQVMLMLHDGGASCRGLAQSFGVSLDIVRNIARGRTWRHVA